MDLRAVRQDVQGLPSVTESVENLRQSWLKPLRSNTNSHLPFLQRLHPDAKKEINQKLTHSYETIAAVRHGAVVQEKLQSCAHQVTELKLALLRTDSQKAKMIRNRLLNDEFLSLPQLVADVQKWDRTINLMREQYDEVNRCVQGHLSLEESLLFMGLPHKIHLMSLVKTAREHKRIVRQLGESFVEIVKKMPKEVNE